MQTTPTRILLVDDDQGDFEMIRVMLSQAEHGQFTMDWVATYEEALDAFEREAHDVYFVDYFLEDRTGLDLLHEAQRRGISAPIIMLTGRGNRAVDQQALEAGAADYLVKGLIDPAALERSVRHSLERSRTARALRESEERHRSLFEHFPVGLYRCTSDGTLIDANPTLIRILGYPEREALVHSAGTGYFVHSKDRQRFWNLLSDHGVVRGFESSLTRPDGTRIRVRNTARLHRDARGETVYLEGALEDVTEEKPVDTDRQEIQDEFHTAIHNSCSAMVLVSLGGQILARNPAFAGLFPVRDSQPSGVSLGELLEESDRPHLDRELEQIGLGEKIRAEAERRFVGKEEVIFWGRTTTTVIQGVEGKPALLLIALEPTQ